MLTINKKNSLTPKIPKMCDPILVTLENVTSGTSPLASYKAVTPPPPTHGSFFIISTCFKYRSITYNTKIFFFLLQDASILYKTLKSNTFIIGLDLGYNTIGDEGAEIIAQLLQVYVKKKLYLNNQANQNGFSVWAVTEISG